MKPPPMPEPDLYVGTKLVPYERRHFGTAGLAQRLGYTSDVREYHSMVTVHARDAQWAALLDAAVAQERERCALSWNSFFVYGNKASIEEVKNLINRAGTVPYLQERLAKAEKWRDDRR